MIKIKEIWFSDDQIFGRGEDGRIYSQSLLWYPRLQVASAEERGNYTFDSDGIHWRNINEDISFESFVYEDAHKEINIAELNRLNQEAQKAKKDYQKYKVILDRGLDPGSLLKEETVLFVGMNPSFQESDSIHNGPQSKSYPRYFNRIKEITEKVNKELNTSYPFAHQDLFFVRHSSQAEVLEMKKVLQEFFDAQLSISKKLIENAKPVLIVVANASACSVFKVLFENQQWNDDLGAYKVMIGESYVPVLYTGMITGQRALDNGSYESLIWHICYILKKHILIQKSRL